MSGDKGKILRAKNYPSKQQSFFKDDVKSLACESKHTIQNIMTYRVPHLDNWIELEKMENCRFRTRAGASGNKGFRVKIDRSQVILADIVRFPELKSAVSFARAGPRDYIVYKEGEVKAAIVTCGGLCPGLNDVVQELVQMLYYNYSVDTIYGIQCGYRGFYEKQYLPYLNLTPQNTRGIHETGGTILRSSRGGFDKDKIIDACIEKGINHIYIIGGDGTHRGAEVLFNEIKRRKAKISLVGIPKTIDNDIGIIDRSFGFNTAVGEAVKAIRSVKVEAQCTPNGIGIVKLMGREAGFITAFATLACREVNMCLIPEIEFSLEGPKGIYAEVEQNLKANGTCVIVIAEGAGENLVKTSSGKDESGNKKLPPIGLFLKDQMTEHFKSKGINVSIKYNDPSYMIRSVPASADDSILCMILAQNAVHGAMAGYTGFTVGAVNGRTCMVPISVICRASPTRLNPNGRTWERVTRSTHQYSKEK